MSTSKEVGIRQKAAPCSAKGKSKFKIGFFEQELSSWFGQGRATPYLNGVDRNYTEVRREVHQKSEKKHGQVTQTRDHGGRKS